MEHMLVKALGMGCQDALGTEIVIMGVITDSTWHQAVEIFENSWIQKQHMYNWRSWDQGSTDTISAVVPDAGYAALVLDKNRWRGICEICYKNQIRLADCYCDSDENDLLVVPLWDSAKPDVLPPDQWVKEREDIFYGKTLCVLGDSYVRNHNRPVTETWHFLFSVKHRMKYCNYGINGNGMVGQAAGKPMLERYQQIPEDTDFIFVMGGKNDYNIQLDLTSFRIGVDQLIQGLKNSYPKEVILFFTPWKIVTEDQEDPMELKLSAYAAEMKNICDKNSIPVFDAERSKIEVWKPEFRAAFMQDVGDFSHLNMQGHQLMLQEAEAFLKQNV